MQLLPVNIIRFVAIAFTALSVLASHSRVFAAPLKSHIDSVDELTYGVVLYDYFQRNYFNALIEYEYSYYQGNPHATQAEGQVLKGGMMLSYGMPEASQKLFSELLDKTTTEDVSNRAWYYLAKIYYNKSEFEGATDSLNRVQGTVPKDIYFDYHYLLTLIGNDQASLDIQSLTEKNLSDYLPGYPYLLFNLAVKNLKVGNRDTAINYLVDVTQYASISHELSVLADRALNGLAQIALEDGVLSSAWKHLAGIKTTGLYSNRALLAYAWSAIKMQRYQDAIPALKLLNERSIAIPEVQETKVLIAHLYEKQGLDNKALQANKQAEKEFTQGMAQVEEARQIINGLDVPREFINNIDAIMAKSDWYASNPSIDYQKLTPFLLDLMSSHAFSEVLKELADLYSIRDNLNYWLERSREHTVVLNNASNRNYDASLREFVQKSAALKENLANKKAELELLTLSLSLKDQKRMQALLKSTRKEINLLNNKITQLNTLESAYTQPGHYQNLVSDNHRKLELQLAKTEKYISALEPVMRRMVNIELDKHESRMHYYWAQSRLAKARLYDKRLLKLEKSPLAKNSVEPLKGSIQK